MRDSERAVMDRLLRSHSRLAAGRLVEPAADPPDAIVECDAGRFGFELTDIFSVGGTNPRGSEFLQFNGAWRQLKEELHRVLRSGHSNLDQCDVYLRLNRQSKNSLDLVNLPSRNENHAFAEQLLRAILLHRPPFNAQAERRVDVTLPSGAEFETLRRYATRVEVIWRRDIAGDLNVAAEVHLPAIEAGYLNTSTEKLESAILRKGHPSNEQFKRMRAAECDELYLLLGGQQTGMFPHLQGQTRQELEIDLTYVRYAYEHSIFHALIFFDDFNDRVEVFCTRCLGARQKNRRIGVGPLNFFTPGMFDVPHVCAALVPQQL